MKVYGVKLKSAIVRAATQGISPYKLEYETGINNLDELARQGVVELDEKKLNLLAEVTGFEPSYFSTDF